MNKAGKKTNSWECRYDNNGCLVEKRNADGSYIEYEYQKLTLTAEQMQAHCRQQQIMTGVHWRDWLFQGGRYSGQRLFPHSGASDAECRSGNGLIQQKNFCVSPLTEN